MFSSIYCSGDSIFNIMIVMGLVCHKSEPNAVKQSAYECGIPAVSDARIEFDIKYFNYAIMFLVFDVETIFLYPFALYINALGLFAMIEAFVFVGLLLFGLVFAVRKRMLRWV